MNIRERMKTKTYKFHSDAGHGWLAVKRKELSELGIICEISPFSYQRGDTVYLEEDCDAYKFVKRYEQILDKKCSFVEKYHERTPIRSYEGFYIK